MESHASVWISHDHDGSGRGHLMLEAYPTPMTVQVGAPDTPVIVQVGGTWISFTYAGTGRGQT